MPLQLMSTNFLLFSSITYVTYVKVVQNAKVTVGVYFATRETTVKTSYDCAFLNSREKEII